MTKFCNDCKYFKKSEVFGKLSKMFNSCCEKVTRPYNSAEYPRVIQYCTEYGDNVSTPKWCPLEGNSDLNLGAAKPILVVKSTKSESYDEKKARWGSKPPTIKWEDLKVGRIYFIPKVISSRPKTIFITSIDDKEMAYREVGEGNKLSTYDLHIKRDSVDAKYIVKKRNFK